MRIRTVKPEFWTNESLSLVSEPAALLALALLNYADDEGYFNANHKLIAAACFPLRELSIPITDAIQELVGIEFIELFQTSNRSYGCVKNFETHQRINRATESKIRQLIEGKSKVNEDSLRTHGGLTEDSLNTHGGLIENSLSAHGRKGKEQGKEKEVEPEQVALKRLPKGMPYLISLLPAHLNTPEVRKALEAYDAMRSARRYPIWMAMTCELKVKQWVEQKLSAAALAHFLNEATMNEYRGIPINLKRFEMHAQNTLRLQSREPDTLNDAIKEAEAELTAKGLV